MSDDEFIVKTESEMSEVMRRMDEDIVDNSTRMSSIDTNSRLFPKWWRACIRLDEMERRGLNKHAGKLSRQIKRLSISLNGEGRKEKIALVGGMREQKTGAGFLQRMKFLFTGKE